jgi:heme/copper-type cytochrome/quinol oxidase subunit 4
MAEQKAKKKAWGIIKLILRAFGLMVLAALIAFALVFEAPWRVIALLLIILAACTVLFQHYWITADNFRRSSYRWAGCPSRWLWT